MKNRIKRITSLLLAIIMIVSLAACNGSNKEDTNLKKQDPGTESSIQEVTNTIEDEENSAAPITFPLDEQITITAIVRDFNRDRTKYIDKLFEQYTNIKIEWTIVPVTDYNTVLNLRLNSGEFPDLIQINKNTVNTFADQGLFVNLADYLDQMPNLQKWIDKIPSIYNDSVTEEGDMYSITTFNTRGQVPRQPIYREDLFTAEGLEAPATIDELYNSLVILKEKYPNSLPIINRWGSGNLIGHVANLYHTKAGIYLDNDTLEYTYGQVTDNFKAAIATLQKFYVAGLIDPEFATISDEQFFERILNGTALYMFAEYTNRMNTESQGDWNGNGKINNPAFNLEVMKPVDTELGNGLLSVQYPTSRGGFTIAVNSKSAYINEIVALLDYQYTDEIIELVNWGLEGETFKVVDGEKQWLIDAEERKNLGLDSRSGMWVAIDQDCFDSTLDPIDLKTVRTSNANLTNYAFYEPKKTLSFTAEELDRISQVMTPIDTFYSEQIISFITGKLNMESDWDDFIRTITDMGYQEILDLYRDKYNNLPEEQKGLDMSIGL